MVLTEEQRARMEQNRATALARRAALQQQERDEYQGALAEALLGDNGEDNQTGVETKSEEPSAGISEDPYIVFDNMDEGEDELGNQESEESEESQTRSAGRGSYSTIKMKNDIVQDFLVTGETAADYVEVHPNILASTLDKWTEACAKEQWPDYLARCSPAELTTAKKVPNWYRSVANALAMAEGNAQPFPMKLGRKRFLHKHEYLQHLVEELVKIIQHRRNLKEKVDLKSAVHTLKRMIKEKEAELESQGQVYIYIYIYMCCFLFVCWSWPAGGTAHLSQSIGIYFYIHTYIYIYHIYIYIYIYIFYIYIYIYNYIYMYIYIYM
jgi:hypothetical protein